MKEHEVRYVLWKRPSRRQYPYIIAEETTKEIALSFRVGQERQFESQGRVYTGIFDWINISNPGKVTVDFLFKNEVK